MLQRHCACGVIIAKNRQLCNGCLNKYGKDPTKWEPWVRFLVRDEQKELDRARRNDFDLELFDETCIPLSDEAAHNLAKAKQRPEMDFEDFVWSNQ